MTWSLALPVLLLLLFGGMSTPHGLEGASVRQAPMSAATYAGFLTMGLLGLNTVSTGIFGLGVVLVQSRNLGVLQRLVLTPQPAWAFVGGHMLAASTIVSVSGALMLTVGMLCFGMPWPASPLAWCAVFGLGCWTFMSFGYALAAAMSEVRTAQVVGNTALLVLMCLGGVWVPLTTLPPVVQWLGTALPLTHYVTLLRAVGLVGQPIAAHAWSVVVLLGWGGVAMTLAVWQFRRHHTW